MSDLPLNNSDYIDVHDLKVHRALYQFINHEVLPGIRIERSRFWLEVAAIVNAFTPTNKKLLAKRDYFQNKLDDWHRKRRQLGALDPVEYEAFLRSIDYIEPTPDAFSIQTEQVDPEITSLAGPQLLAPILNARFAVDACNARWGSLYDALYSSDVIAQDNGCEISDRLNPLRARAVVRYSKQFLDKYFPLVGGKHEQVQHWFIDNNVLMGRLTSGDVTTLAVDSLCGFRGTVGNPSAILLLHHQLHVEIKIDHESTRGRLDPAGIEDVILESALTTIMDLEDTVAIVDVDEKIQAYRHWLALMRGVLSASAEHIRVEQTHRMNSDRHYQTVNGKTFILPGRSVMMIRIVGMHVLSQAIVTSDNNFVPEGILDSIISTTIALYDLRSLGPFQNSRHGSIYIVKPKLHGPEEAHFIATLMTRIEAMLELPMNTIKLGLMDEERRTSLNLIACIEALKTRIVMMNTGFLDRTGDEIHSGMEAGPFLPKSELKNGTWYRAYEESNIAAGLACGFFGRGQLSKGMWPMPEHMAAMLTNKRIHPESGANAAWVPSPRAATLHAIHYHQIRVSDTQLRLLEKPQAIDIKGLLHVPLLGDRVLDAAEIEEELCSNAQSILGYVSRWIVCGEGCVNVPNLFNIPLLEDRATLRIASQHLANWLHHGICTKSQVVEVFKRMAEVVDGQNEGDQNYQPLGPDFAENLAFKAALYLVFLGREQNNGYTENLLYKYRRLQKSGEELVA